MKNTTKNISISGNHLKEYFKIKKTDEKDLAHLLNVNPTSLKRWAAPTDDAPTSTTFLVLLPLLLGAGVDLIPEDENQAVLDVLQKELKNPERKKILRRMLFAQTNEHMKAARKLFVELKQAWENIDAED